MTTQALDNAYISITTAMDPDSGIKLVRAKVDGLVRPSGTWATTCAQEPGVEVLPWISLPTTKVVPGDSQDFVLPVTMLYVHVVVPEGTRTAVGDNLVSLGPLLFGALSHPPPPLSSGLRTACDCARCRSRSP